MPQNYELHFAKFKILFWAILVKEDMKYQNLLNFKLSTEQEKKRNTHALFSDKMLKMCMERLRESMYEYSGKNKSSLLILSFFCIK